jgi:hypothetical protein
MLTQPDTGKSPCCSEFILRYLPVLVCLLGLLPTLALADTTTVYRDARDKIVQVRILDAGSGTRTAYGSGFAVDAKGDIVTNFHVVADLVDKPGQFVIETLDPAGQKQSATLLAFDAVNDLALLHVPVAPKSFVEMAKKPTEQGARLYSLGLPMDQGFTISEGTYNGLVPDALTPRIHFTGPVNPGVSGGPAIDQQGQLVGVNVSTMGNSIGHLVPAAQVAALLASAGSKPLTASQSASMLGNQLLRHQQDFIGKVLGAPWPSVKLGSYAAPGQIAPWMKCWANSEHVPTNLYGTTSYVCYPGTNEIFVSERLRSGTVTVEHSYVTADKLGRQRFAWLMSQQTQGSGGGFGGSREDAGNFQCQDGFIKQGGLTLNTTLCVRALRKLPGLFDAALESVSIGGPGSGLISQLKIRGASYDNVLRLSQKFVEQILWKP